MRIYSTYGPVDFIICCGHKVHMIKGHFMTSIPTVEGTVTSSLTDVAQ